jgi:hypothetical protein
MRLPHMQKSRAICTKNLASVGNRPSGPHLTEIPTARKSSLRTAESSHFALSRVLLAFASM